ncbi:MAG: hypothetical protein HY606_02210 [Planctomycetes bacterium]|nr:hypothetical protein [Planctomycetota bacterium]
MKLLLLNCCRMSNKIYLSMKQVLKYQFQFARSFKVSVMVLAIFCYVFCEINCGAPSGKSSGSSDSASGSNSTGGGTLNSGSGSGGSGGSESSTSAPGSFDLQAPSNDSYITTSAFTLSWSNPTGESSFTVQISQSVSFPNPLLYAYDISSSDITSHQIPAGVLPEGSTYYWRAVAKNSAGATFSSNAPFTIKYFKPVAFDLSSPGANATGVPISTTLSWASSTNATSYRVYVSADSGFSSFLSGFPKTVTSASTGLSGLSYSTSYYWKVEAINELGTTFSTTSYFKFTTLADPGGGGLVQPTGGGESEGDSEAETM